MIHKNELLEFRIRVVVLSRWLVVDTQTTTLTEASIPAAATAHDNQEAVNDTVNDDDSWRLQLPTSAARMVKERARAWFPATTATGHSRLEAAALQYRRRKPVAATVPAKRPKSVAAAAGA
jgi:hypothetical protein